MFGATMHGHPKFMRKTTTLCQTKMQIRFCPFCKESFEGVEVCPFHDLPLVAVDALRAPKSTIDSEQPLGMYDLRFGRGQVLFGSIFLFLSFGFPIFKWADRPVSMLHVANEGALHLWLIPVVSITCVVMLWRNRSTPLMRRIRWPIFGLALLACMSIGYTLWHVASLQGLGQPSLVLHWPALVCALGIGLILVGGWRLSGP